MQRSLSPVAWALGALAVFAGPALAAPFENGRFVSPGSGDYSDFLSANLIPGWTYSNPDFPTTDIDQYLEAGSYGFTPTGGGPFISFGGDSTYGGSITQTFDTVSGTEYTIGYEVAEIQGADSTQDLNATLINGTQTISQDFNPTNDIADVPQAVAQSITFTAQGASSTITFTDDTPPGDGVSSNIALGDVSLSVGPTVLSSAVPEPGTWAMMLMGVAGIGYVARRRHAAAAQAA